ncbi:MAG: hypothetical protein KDK70_16610 [Myxococcales bacterium]|nr:hypothetical protein [Myxococcales bacterium]
MMVLERMALRAIALCMSDAIEDGRAVARRLLAEHPEAPHRARVQRACSVE